MSIGDGGNPPLSFAGANIRNQAQNLGTHFGKILRLRDDGSRVVAEDKLTIGQRVRDVRQGPDGYLYVLTDQHEGQLLRILPATPE